MEEKIEGTERLKKSLRKEGISPDRANALLNSIKSNPIDQQVKLSALITRPGVSINDLLLISEESKKLAEELSGLNKEIVSQTEIQLKYEGYIGREQEVADKMNRLEEVKIAPDLDYKKLQSLSTEAKEKLSKIQPETIGQASRISGVSPSDISVLLIYLGR